ncbi:MAG: hypothetical protein AAF846_14810, partial [Chloroflexota bacterium]
SDSFESQLSLGDFMTKLPSENEKKHTSKDRPLHPIIVITRSLYLNGYITRVALPFTGLLLIMAYNINAGQTALTLQNVLIVTFLVWLQTLTLINPSRIKKLYFDTDYFIDDTRLNNYYYIVLCITFVQISLLVWFIITGIQSSIYLAVVFLLVTLISNAFVQNTYAWQFAEIQRSILIKFLQDDEIKMKFDEVVKGYWQAKESERIRKLSDDNNALNDLDTTSAGSYNQDNDEAEEPMSSSSDEDVQ